MVWLILWVTQGFSQKWVSGVVVDTKGNPVFAANVYPKSKVQNGVTTNFQGYFKVQVSGNADTLVASFVGYKTTTYSIQSADSLYPTTIV